MPPLVGYASAAGHLGWAALVMFGIVFLWTPPHFWALALMIKEHYANADVPMLPGRARRPRDGAADRAGTRSALVAATLVPVAFGVFGLVYGVAALVLGALFAWMALQLWRELTRPRAVGLFHYSLLYLALLFVAMAARRGRRVSEALPPSRPPDLMTSAVEETPELARKNMRWAWSLFGLSLLLFGGTFAVGLVYLWL